MTRLLPLLLLSACGGDPFTLLVVPTPDAPPADVRASVELPDAGADHAKPSEAPDASSSVVDSAHDALSEAPGVDAPSPQDALADVASEPYATQVDAGAPDAPYAPPDACTPFPSPQTWAQSCDGVMATVPNDFFQILAQPCGGQPTGARLATATPKACQCLETYSCACLDQYGVCGSGKRMTSCSPSPNVNTEIVVNCN